MGSLPYFTISILATYTKPHLSLDDQLGLLKQRGLQVSDNIAAKDFLRHNGYYRLSAYWYPFREIVGSHRSDNFLPNSRFEHVRDLCTFDKKFKLLLLDAIEGVEIAVRAEIALLLGASDTFAHINPNFFRPSFIKLDSLGETKHQKWLRKFNESVKRSKDEFVLHHERKYGNRYTLPIWIAIELWDFGLLSHFYSGMDTTHCISVATRFSISNWNFMASWLRSLNYVRNVIAHHGRLWNLNLVESPSLPSRRGLMADFDALVPLRSVNTRIYSICCILSHFSKSINQRSSWSQRLTELINSFPIMPYVGVQDMGFPTDWQNHNFWK